MSEENVEIVRTALAALNRGDLDAAFKDAAPDAELTSHERSAPHAIHESTTPTMARNGTRP